YRCAHMGNYGICPRIGHLYSLFGLGHIYDGEHIHPGGQPYHLYLFLKAHARFLQDAPKMTIDNGMGRKVIYARKAHILYLSQKMPHSSPGIAAMYPADYWNLLYHRQHFKFPDFHSYGIGIPISHHPGRGTVSGHPEPTCIVYYDWVLPPLFSEFLSASRIFTSFEYFVFLAQHPVQSVTTFQVYITSHTTSTSLYT